MFLKQKWTNPFFKLREEKSPLGLEAFPNWVFGNPCVAMDQSPLSIFPTIHAKLMKWVNYATFGPFKIDMQLYIIIWHDKYEHNLYALILIHEKIVYLYIHTNSSGAMWKESDLYSA